MSRFEEQLARFFYRPDEEVGPFLELAPELEAGAAHPIAEVPEEFLAFILGGETYAVPIAAVREILRVPAVTEVPRAPANVLGVINIRGEMLPLYDIRVRLGLATSRPAVHGPSDMPRSARVVLLRELEGDAGVLVERVVGVVKLGLSKLEAAPALGRERDCIAGLARRGDQLFILLDVEEALA